MTDFLSEVEKGRSYVQPEWNPDTVDRALARLHRRINRRRTYARLAGATAVVVAVAAGAWPVSRLIKREMTRRTFEASEKATVAHATARPREVRFEDGSTARLLDPDSALTLVEDTPSRATASLERGVGQFEVQKRAGRLFRVTAGDINIHVLGTAFTVDRTESAVGVWVSRGRVRVEWPGGTALLTSGDHAWFPSPGLAPGAVADPDEGGTTTAAPPAAHATGRTPHTRLPRTNDWLQFAEQGRYSDAYALLRHVAPAKLRDPESLLTAADVARLSGHANAAVSYFERVLTHHGTDSRAPVAAFSLGRILLNSLRRPGDAAARFALARRLSPAGSLAQDALARETEAWSRAGLPTNARAAAEEYLTTYPNGRWVQAVRRYGGVE